MTRLSCRKQQSKKHVLSVNKPNFNISSSADLITLQYSGMRHPYGNKTPPFLYVRIIAQGTAITFIVNDTDIVLETPSWSKAWSGEAITGVSARCWRRKHTLWDAPLLIIEEPHGRKKHFKPSNIMNRVRWTQVCVKFQGGGNCVFMMYLITA